MEIRELKISANISGGTAAAGAKTYRITLPSSWVKKMDLDHADAKAEVVFDGTKHYHSSKGGRGYSFISIAGTQSGT